MKHSPDPVTQQYNDVIEGAINDAHNALMPWTTRLTLANAEKAGTGGSTPLHQAAALDFVANTFIDGLNAIIAKLETGWKYQLKDQTIRAEFGDTYAVARYDVKGVPKTSDVISSRGNAGAPVPPVTFKPAFVRPEPKAEVREDPHKPPAAKPSAP